MNLTYSCRPVRSRFRIFNFLSSCFIVLLFSCVVACPVGGEEMTRIGALPLSALKFYVIVDGKMETRVLTGPDLREESFETSGYISGIVAVGPKGVEARVDGRNMFPVQPKADGTVSLGYYGKIKPAQLLEKETGVGPVEPIDPKNCPRAEVYSFFPTVPADTVNHNDRFAIDFKSGADELCMQVRHNGARMLETSGDAQSLPFRYIGGDRTRTAGWDERIDAVSKGVAAVEAAFDMDLVSRVNVVGFDKIRNAVTCVGENEIWFYVNTFKNEPVGELNVIAEHEALHILVDRLDLTRNRIIRNLFADLKGFDTFSIDRFRLITQGRSRSDARKVKGEMGYFFDFISEKNFLNGMKGGHPQEDLDEFCTSFLHTLMYMETFEAHMAAAGTLNHREKATIIENYRVLLEIVRDAFSRVASVSADGTVASAEKFISERLERVAGMQLQAAKD